MKRNIFQTLTLAAITLFLAVISAQAQGGHRYQSSVPFDFTVGDRSFKAGDYTLTVVNPASDKPVFAIRNLVTGESQLLTTMPKVSNPRQETSSLNFKRVDGQYYLAAMSDPELSVQFRQPKRVRELARRDARSTTVETVAIGLKRR